MTLAGGADAVSGLFRGVIWNQTIPDALRGRLASIELISYSSSGPLLGDMSSGEVAAAFTPRISVHSGSIICVLVVGALALPQLRFRVSCGEAHWPPARASASDTSSLGSVSIRATAHKLACDDHAHSRPLRPAAHVTARRPRRGVRRSKDRSCPVLVGVGAGPSVHPVRWTSCRHSSAMAYAMIHPPVMFKASPV